MGSESLSLLNCLRLKLIVWEDVICLRWLKLLCFGRVQVFLFRYRLLLSWLLLMRLRPYLLLKVNWSSTLISCTDLFELKHIIIEIFRLVSLRYHSCTADNWLSHFGYVEPV